MIASIGVNRQAPRMLLSCAACESMASAARRGDSSRAEIALMPKTRANNVLEVARVAGEEFHIVLDCCSGNQDVQRAVGDLSVSASQLSSNTRGDSRGFQINIE